MLWDFGLAWVTTCGLQDWHSHACTPPPPPAQDATHATCKRVDELRLRVRTGACVQVPFGAYGLYLLGKVCRLMGRLAEAKDYYSRALRLNPLLWSAFDELCAVGERCTC